MARIYVGNLPMDIRERDVEDLFYKYGRIRDIDLKTPNRPPAYAFVSFDDYYDAEAAVRGRDGVMLEGQRLRVEMSLMSRGGRGGGGGYDDRDRYGGRGGGYGGGGYGGPPPRAPPRNLRRSEHRVIVSGLPPSASWQDLKDHFRPCGDVIYTDVDRHGGGIVEFASRDDQEEAISKLDDKEFKNNFDGSRTYLRVKKPKDQMTDEEFEREKERDKEIEERRGKKDSSRSRSRSGRRSRSRSARSRSRSRSPRRDDDKGDGDKATGSDAAAEEEK
eukprot:Tamp_10948.p1 GENE.Tamp_10948~~Tamp_10948.p1  ORF type:complete len:292 (+),score=77.30 Tamp_10948:54-878(+)